MSERIKGPKRPIDRVISLLLNALPVAAIAYMTWAGAQKEIQTQQATDELRMGPFADLCAKDPYLYLVEPGDNIHNLARTLDPWGWLLKREHVFDEDNPGLGDQNPAWLYPGQVLNFAPSAWAKMDMPEFFPNLPDNPLAALRELDPKAADLLVVRVKATRNVPLDQLYQLFRTDRQVARDICVMHMYTGVAKPANAAAVEALALYEMRMRTPYMQYYLTNFQDTIPYLDNLLFASSTQLQFPQNWQEDLIFALKHPGIGGGESYRDGGPSIIMGAGYNNPNVPPTDHTSRIFDITTSHELGHVIQAEQIPLNSSEQERFSHVAMGIFTLPTQHLLETDTTADFMAMLDPRVQFVFMKLVNAGHMPEEIYTLFVRASMVFVDTPEVEALYMMAKGPEDPTFTELFAQDDINSVANAAYLSYVKNSKKYTHDFLEIYRTMQSLSGQNYQIPSYDSGIHAQNEW